MCECMKQEVFLDQCCLHLVKWSIPVTAAEEVRSTRLLNW